LSRSSGSPEPPQIRDQKHPNGRDAVRQQHCRCVSGRSAGDARGSRAVHYIVEICSAIPLVGWDLHFQTLHSRRLLSIMILQWHTMLLWQGLVMDEIALPDEFPNPPVQWSPRHDATLPLELANAGFALRGCLLECGGLSSSHSAVRRCRATTRCGLHRKHRSGGWRRPGTDLPLSRERSAIGPKG